MQGGSLLIMLVLMVGLMYFSGAVAKEQCQNGWKVQINFKRNEVITIGGLYGTIIEVDADRKTVVLDVDGLPDL